jgi:hypothetical protein
MEDLLYVLQIDVEVELAMNGKKAEGMTVPRLIKYILLIVVLILIIYGVRSQLMGPLKDRIINAANEVLLWLNIKNTNGTVCYEEFLKESSAGSSVLDSLGISSDIDRYEYRFRVCSGGECSVSIEDERYRKNSGVLEKSYDGKTWVSVEEYHFGERKAGEVKKEWQLYNHAMDLLEEKLGKEILNSIFKQVTTMQFELYGDSSGPLDFSEKYFVWENGVWKMYLGKKLIGQTRDDFEAIDKFYKLVTERVDDNVAWRISIAKSAAESYLGDPEYHGEGIGL